MLPHSHVATMTPATFMTIREFTKGADCSCVQTNVFLVEQMNLMASCHVVCKIITHHVLVSADTTAQRRRLPCVSQLVMTALRFPHFQTARRAVPRRRESPRTALQRSPKPHALNIQFLDRIYNIKRTYTQTYLQILE